MKTILPPATLEHPEDQWRIDWLHEHAAVDEEFEYPQVNIAISFSLPRIIIYTNPSFLIKKGLVLTAVT